MGDCHAQGAINQEGNGRHAQGVVTGELREAQMAHRYEEVQIVVQLTVYSFSPFPP